MAQETDQQANLLIQLPAVDEDFGLVSSSIDSTEDHGLITDSVDTVDDYGSITDRRLKTENFVVDDGTSVENFDVYTTAVQQILSPVITTASSNSLVADDTWIAVEPEVRISASSTSKSATDLGFADASVSLAPTSVAVFTSSDEGTTVTDTARTPAVSSTKSAVDIGSASETNVETSASSTVFNGVETGTSIVSNPFYGFETGQFDSDWTILDNQFEIKSNVVYDGTYSAGIESTSVPTDVAILEPTKIRGGQRIQSFRLYWYETSSSTGGGVRLLDSDGNPVIGAATDNPEFDIEDGNGFVQVDGSGSYNTWYKIEFIFHWDRGTVDVYRNNDAFLERPLINNTNIEAIEFKEYHSTVWGGHGYMYMWFDNIELDYLTVPSNASLLDGVETADAILDGNRVDVSATQFEGVETGSLTLTDGYLTSTSATSSMLNEVGVDTQPATITPVVSAVFAGVETGLQSFDALKVGVFGDSAVDYGFITESSSTTEDYGDLTSPEISKDYGSLDSLLESPLVADTDTGLRFDAEMSTADAQALTATSISIVHDESNVTLSDAALFDGVERGIWTLEYPNQDLLVAQDKTPNNNDGVLTTGIQWNVDGPTDNIRSALTFTGATGNSLIIPDSSNLAIGDNLSISFWLRLEAFHDNYARRIRRDNGIEDANWNFYIFGNNDGNNSGNEGRIGFYGTAAGEWGSISSSYYPNLNEWVHIGFEYNSINGGQLYINGEPEGSRTNSGTLATPSTEITFDSGPHSISDFRIWNQSRTESEIQSDKDKRLNGDDSGLVGYWTLDDGLVSITPAHAIEQTSSDFGQVTAESNITSVDSIEYTADDRSVLTVDGTISSSAANVKTADDDGSTIGVLSISASTSISATLSEVGTTNETGTVTLAAVLPAAFSADGTDYIDGIITPAIGVVQAGDDAAITNVDGARTSVAASDQTASDAGIISVEAVQTVSTSTVFNGVETGSIDANVSRASASATSRSGVELGYITVDADVKPSTSTVLDGNETGIWAQADNQDPITPVTAIEETSSDKGLVQVGSDVTDAVASVNSGDDLGSIVVSVDSVAASTSALETMDSGIEYISGSRTEASMILQSADEMGSTVVETSITDAVSTQFQITETGLITTTGIVSGVDSNSFVLVDTGLETLSGISTGIFGQEDDYGLVSESFDVSEDFGSITAIADVSYDYGTLDYHVTSPLETDAIGSALLDSSRVPATVEPLTVDGIGSTTLSGVVTLTSAEFRQGDDVGFETLAATVTAATSDALSVDETGIVDIDATRTSIILNALEGDEASVETLDGDVIPAAASALTASDDGLTIGILSISTSTSISATLSEIGHTEETGTVTTAEVLPAAFSANGTDYIDGIRTSVVGAPQAADDLGSVRVETDQVAIESSISFGDDIGSITATVDLVDIASSIFAGVETGSIDVGSSLTSISSDIAHGVDTGFITVDALFTDSVASIGTGEDRGYITVDSLVASASSITFNGVELGSETLQGIITGSFVDEDDYGYIADSIDESEDYGAITSIPYVSYDFGQVDHTLTPPRTADDIGIALESEIVSDSIATSNILAEQGSESINGDRTEFSSAIFTGSEIGIESINGIVSDALGSTVTSADIGSVLVSVQRTGVDSSAQTGVDKAVETLDGSVTSASAVSQDADEEGRTIGILSISTSTSISATLSEKGLTNEVGNVTLVDVLPAAFSADGTDYIDGIRTSITGSSVLADDTGLFTIEGIRTDVTSTVEQGVDTGTIDVDTDIVPASASTFQGVETGLAKDGTIENVTVLPSTPIAVGIEYIGGIRTNVTTTPATADDAGETFVNSQVTLFGSDVLEGVVSSTGSETTEVYEGIVSIGTSIDVGVDYINGDKTYSSVDVVTADDVAKTIGILNIPTSTAIVEPSKEYSASFDNASITPVSVLSPAFAANGTDYIDGIVTSANAQSTITDDRRLAADQPQDVDVIADTLVASESGLQEGEIYSVTTSTETAIEQGTTASSADTQDAKGNVQTANDIGTSISDAADVGVAASPVTSAETTLGIVSPNVESVAAESTSTIETSSATDTAEANSVAATATTVQARGDIVVDLAVLDVSAKANQVTENSIWQPEASVTGSSTTAQSSTETTKANPGNVVLTVDVAFGTSTERTTTQEQDIEAEFGVTPKTTEDTGSSEIDGIISEAFANALEAVSTIPFMPGIDDFHVTPMIGYEGVDSDASIHYTRTRGGGYIKYTDVSGSTRLMPVMDKVSASPDIKYNDIKGTPS